jgi:hypothetical protein
VPVRLLGGGLLKKPGTCTDFCLPDPSKQPGISSYEGPRMTASTRCWRALALAAGPHGSSPGKVQFFTTRTPEDALRGVFPAAKVHPPFPSLIIENLALRIDLGPFAHPPDDLSQRGLGTGVTFPRTVLLATEARALPFLDY